MFWIISILIVVVTISMLLTAVRRPPKPLDESLNSRSLHGSRVRELDRDLADDLISIQDASIAQDEIDR
ncbi:MAG: c-type cytochrome biogenesis protein CcmI, partial [Gammaproteobacteria bacterium]